MALCAVEENAASNAIEKNFEVTARDLIGEDCEGIDVILVGDMFYDTDFSEKLLTWITALAKRLAPPPLQHPRHLEGVPPRVRKMSMTAV